MGGHCEPGRRTSHRDSFEIVGIRRSSHSVAFCDHYFFTGGQVDCDSGWKASSAGMVATSL
jgi:hypothetical protein